MKTNKNRRDNYTILEETKKSGLSPPDKLSHGTRTWGELGGVSTPSLKSDLVVLIRGVE